MYFAIGFLVLWIIVALLLFGSFKKALINSFDEQLKARAFVVAQKTNTQPKIVPLPQGEESFTILYSDTNGIDTLFAPATVPFTYPSGSDSIISNKGWHVIRIQQAIESGGSLQVIFALPSASIDSKIKELTKLLLLILPLGFLLALVLSYWLSSKLLKPVNQVIRLANATNINNNIELLPEPESENELKDLVMSFNRMLLRIKEQSGRQTAFFASASHELRTPLTVMQTRLQVLMKNADTATKNVYAEQLKEVQQLIKMANDFLLLSELRSGNMQVTKTNCNLSDLLTEKIAGYKNKAAKKNILFKISYQTAEETYDVLADENKLQIIIGNLLENAIKYSPQAATIDILLQKHYNNFSVSITNKIREDISPQIADVKNEFYHSKPLHGEGFGLGLWIANQLAAIQDFEMYFTKKEKEKFEAVIVFNNQL